MLGFPKHESYILKMVIKNNQQMKLVLKKDQQLFFTSDTHYNHTNICSATTKWVPTNRNTRQFNSLDEMNNTLVNNINEVVGENDILIHLGDWSFGGFDSIAEFRDRINCKNIHLIYGNHDHHIRKNKLLTDRYLENGEVVKGDTIYNYEESFHCCDKWTNQLGVQSLFESCHEYLFLDVRRPADKGRMDKFSFVCMHYPIASWDNMNSGVIHLHGHVHLPPHQRVASGKAMDVGVDGNGLKPISLDEVLKIMKGRPVKKLSLSSDHHEQD